MASDVSMPLPLEQAIQRAWSRIAPFWPIQNLIAVNPLQGFEHLPFETALAEAHFLFQAPDIPPELHAANRITIKWGQLLMDQGQARIGIASKHIQLFDKWKEVAIWDSELTRNCPDLSVWLQTQPQELLEKHLHALHIPSSRWDDFLTLALTTLPGWAAHVKYIEDWSLSHHHSCKVEYLAIRLTIIRALWPSAAALLSWFDTLRRSQQNTPSLILDRIQVAESTYHAELKTMLEARIQSPVLSEAPQVQMAFCIDVRSESIRRLLESMGPYETFGVAGFFGIPVQISDHLSLETFSVCPVLIRPEHRVHDRRSAPSWKAKLLKLFYSLQRSTRYLYRTLKYTFTVPFALVEIVGGVLGLGMASRTLLPTFLGLGFSNLASEALPSHLDTDEAIPEKDQLRYAETMLRSIGLTQHFSRLIVWCGHGSATQNNAMASALDCGACGGRHGDRNARILAQILNKPGIRDGLRSKGIFIPESTQFVAALHNTTTDDMRLIWETDMPTDPTFQALLKQFQCDLTQVKVLNSEKRMRALGYSVSQKKSPIVAKKLSLDWAQARPEWGLCRNAAIIVGNRSLTRNLDLGGRAFLHSYDWEQDPEGTILLGILNAPVVVAHWINSHYLFATLDTIAFGGGSKVTQNITGKHSLMQGNGSDLVTGLPMQSLYINPAMPYHEPLRLSVVIMAPIDRIRSCMDQSLAVRQLFVNQWAHCLVIDPNAQTIQSLF